MFALRAITVNRAAATVIAAANGATSMANAAPFARSMTIVPPTQPALNAL